MILLSILQLEVYNTIMEDIKKPTTASNTDAEEYLGWIPREPKPKPKEILDKVLAENNERELHAIKLRPLDKTYDSMFLGGAPASFVGGRRSRIADALKAQEKF